MENNKLSALEQELRNLVDEKIGDQWREDVTERQLHTLETRAETDTDSRAGRQSNARLLDQLDFKLLLNIIELHPTELMSVLGDDQDIVRAFFRVLLRYRNCVAHSRPLLPFERAHVQSIATEFLNNIALHHSETQSATTFYPHITSATDECGRTGLAGLGLWGGSGYHAVTPPLPRLRAGAQMVFTCRAVDPAGRRLYWSVNNTLAAEFDDTSPSSESEAEVSVPWTPPPGLYGETVAVTIRMRSESDYHCVAPDPIYAGDPFDDSVIFHYSINPPAPGPSGSPRAV